MKLLRTQLITRVQAALVSMLTHQTELLFAGSPLRATIPVQTSNT
nr:MAG TPA: hypothetical protein [Caudoviricetes sp.]